MTNSDQVAIDAVDTFNDLIGDLITGTMVLRVYHQQYRTGGAFKLDTGRPVIWCISRIAISGAPNALDLIHDLLLAPISIGLRSVSSLIRTQGIGDLDRIYLEAQRDGLDFHLAYIPDDFNAKSAQPFDPVYMKKLFDVGHNPGEERLSVAADAAWIRATRARLNRRENAAMKIMSQSGSYAEVMALSIPLDLWE